MVLPVHPDFQDGVLSERHIQQYLRRRDDHDASDAVASWQQYTAQLGQQLAQAQAESYAAQFQRNVFAVQLDAVQAELRRVDPKNALADEVAITRARCKQVDEHLLARGLQIDRSNPKVFAVRGRLR